MAGVIVMDEGRAYEAQKWPPPEELALIEQHLSGEIRSLAVHALAYLLYLINDWNGGNAWAGLLLERACCESQPVMQALLCPLGLRPPLTMSGLIGDADQLHAMEMGAVGRVMRALRNRHKGLAVALQVEMEAYRGFMAEMEQKLLEAAR